MDYEPAQASQLTVGTKIYWHTYDGISIREGRITAITEHRMAGVFIETDGKHEMSASDRGVPGLAYDNRPPRIYFSREAAEATKHLTETWWVNFIRSNR